MMKQRSALRVELEEARNESARVGAPRIADVVAVHGDATDADALATDLVTRHHEGVTHAVCLTPEQQHKWMDSLLRRRIEHPAAEQRIEHTYDRVLLGERFRRRLDRRYGRSYRHRSDWLKKPSGMSAAESYVAMMNGEDIDQPPATEKPTADPLRMAVGQSPPNDVSLAVTLEGCEPAGRLERTAQPASLGSLKKLELHGADGLSAEGAPAGSVPMRTSDANEPSTSSGVPTKFPGQSCKVQEKRRKPRSSRGKRRMKAKL
jgi:hypothetical protein